MDNPPEVDGAGAKLVDINGDGLSDVVLVQGDKVRYRLNQNGRVFGSEVSLAAPSMPSGASLRFADLNGNGSTDVVWLTPSGKVSLLELFPRRPNLLRTITTGIGKVIDVTYGSSVAHMALDASQDKPWAHRLPNPTLTVDEIATSDTLTGVRQVRRFRYRDGYYDGEERQFRGFESVTVQTPGDGTVESGTTVHDFDVGRQDRYHKALLLRQTTSSARRTLKVDDKAYVDCVVAGVPSGTEPPVRYVCMASSQSTPQEGLSAGQWVVTREAYEYDGWGNQTLVEKHGVVSIGGGACGACNRADDVMGAPCGPRCLGDESFEETEFIVPLAEQSPWILHKPRVKRSWGAQSSAHARETRFYYDGQPFQGLPVGQLTKGLPTRTEELL
ncbi:MAG: FG-GAP-like repeat-containing protein, partial [Polyangiaceae bacterium]|nr:FG-GAP-like repeat-containing protein [Polyangiaceae bacterium]